MPRAPVAAAGFCLHRRITIYLRGKFDSHNPFYLVDRLRLVSPLKIEYRNPTIRTVCTNTTVARRTYGLSLALKIRQRCTPIKQAECIGELLDKREDRCHRLQGGVILVIIPETQADFPLSVSFLFRRKIIIRLAPNQQRLGVVWIQLFTEPGLIFGEGLNKSGLTEHDHKEAEFFASHRLIPTQDYETFAAAKDFSSQAVTAFADAVASAPDLGSTERWLRFARKSFSLGFSADFLR